MNPYSTLTTFTLIVFKLLLGLIPWAEANPCQDLFLQKLPPSNHLASTDLRSVDLSNPETFQHLYESRFREVEAQTRNEEEIFFDGILARRLSKTQGLSNSGIYQILNPNPGAPPKVVKIFLNSKRGARHHDDFRPIVLGNLLGSLAGAATIYRFGSITFDGDLANKKFFIEMEHIFPNDSESRTVKNNAVKDREVIITLRSLEQIASQILLVLENKILITDPDWIHDSNGNFRWLDADLWGFSEARRRDIPKLVKSAGLSDLQTLSLYDVLTSLIGSSLTLSLEEKSDFQFEILHGKKALKTQDKSRRAVINE